MSGVQGAQPMGTTTPTTYESVEGGENRTRASLFSREDEGRIEIQREEDKVTDTVGQKLDLALRTGKEDNNKDTAVSGTGGGGDGV
ncbi:Seed maturation protein PM41 [Rhynchospora pubera]|uniref:Seed maturation protein PM41 n=1 Tax=Rhynchospora pubera TaxID=906938 RepID=A0AAV8F4B6_9POAL|nr:Seed maturation protein PM41 [Rhynchospora pubera]